MDSTWSALFCCGQTRVECDNNLLEAEPVRDEQPPLIDRYARGPSSDVPSDMDRDEINDDHAETQSLLPT